MQTLIRSGILILAATGLLACASTGEKPGDNTCNNCGEISSIDQRAARGSDARSRFGEDALSSLDSSLSQPGLQTLDANRLSRQLGTGRTLNATDLRSLTPQLVRVYEVVVGMDRGPSQRVVVESVAGLRIGERVRVVGNQLLPAP